MSRRVYIREMIVEVLQDRGVPLHYKAITQEVLQRGARFTGRTPDNSVISILLRSEEVVSLGSGLYGLRQWGCGAASRRASHDQHDP